MPSLKSIRKATWPPLLPPSGENAEEARIRLEQEAEAKRISDSIDRALSAEREQLKKRASDAKILLLGQAESGKSTVLKNFQLHFSPRAFEAEAILWRPVIHLNLVRSVNFIVNLLKDVQNSPTQHSTESDGSRRYILRLAPLAQVEESLTKKISGPAASSTADGIVVHYHRSRASEVELRSDSGWKGLFKVKRHVDKSPDDSNRRVVAACADDILQLWGDASVQACLKAHNVVLEDQPGFFLPDVKRVTEGNYTPTPADILRARVATIGPEEHHIHVEGGLAHVAQHWTIYDVGGSRSQRAAWAQFFDDVNSIVFLAPMSAFNQNLEEDESVNRLVDSIRLWEQICANRILASVELVLFLNKQDILDAKLKSGIQMAKYFPSYGHRPNDAEHVSKYLRDTFVALHQKYSPKTRKLHTHLTCAVDTHATSSVIKSVEELVMLKILSQSSIL